MKPILLLLSVLGFCIAAKGFDEFSHAFVKPRGGFWHIAQCMRLLKPHGAVKLSARSSHKSVGDLRLTDTNRGATFVPPLKLSSKRSLSSRFSPMAKFRWILSKSVANTADLKVKAKNKSNYVNPMHCIRCSKHKATD